MKAEIISIGNELLIGQVVNTNSAWMAEQMNLAGFPVGRVTAIRDDREEILAALADSGKRSDLTLVTGGLGPTKDDITKEALCSFFGTRLVFSQEAYDDIERLFAIRGYKVTMLNRKQAEIPKGCIPIPNKNGTARGMWFEGRKTGDGKRKTGDGGNGQADNEIQSSVLRLSPVYVFLPGVPFEMKPMMTDWVIPRLKETFRAEVIYHKTVLTQGIGESFLSEILEEWENALPGNISLAYLPQPGIVRLRLSGTGNDEEIVRTAVLEEVKKMEALIPEHVFGYDNDTLEEIVGRLLLEKTATLSTAESCTGGAIAGLITRVPGCSRYYKGSVVAYSNEIKIRELGVNEELIRLKGAVSEEVVTAMAVGVQKRIGTDYAVATSGIAGPEGGTGEKPAGTTWIAVATPSGVTASRFLMGDDRERNIRRTALQALNMLRKRMID
jgi:nicotinamide-nucleotide amidase